eukprot:2605815-Pleurochrysis_carterae.AAC.1
MHAANCVLGRQAAVGRHLRSRAVGEPALADAQPVAEALCIMPGRAQHLAGAAVVRHDACGGADSPLSSIDHRPRLCSRAFAL